MIVRRKIVEEFSVGGNSAIRPIWRQVDGEKSTSQQEEGFELVLRMSMVLEG